MLLSVPDILPVEHPIRESLIMQLFNEIYELLIFRLNKIYLSWHSEHILFKS